MNHHEPPASEQPETNGDGAELDFDLLNRGIHVAAELMLSEGMPSGEALHRGWETVGIDPASIPISIKKLPGMLLPGIVERARREGGPVRVGGLIPVPRATDADNGL